MAMCDYVRELAAWIAAGCLEVNFWRTIRRRGAEGERGWA